MEDRLRACPGLEAADDELLWEAKQHGFSDRQLAHLWNTSDIEVRRVRMARGIAAVFKLVDTCAAEFEAYTPYYYSTYERPSATVPLAGVAHLESIFAERRRRNPPAQRQGPHHDPGRRSQSHRPGNRVRLLLLPGRLRAARGRLRDDHGQLESRRRCPPTTTPATCSSSSRLPPKTCSTSATGSSPRGSSCSSAARRRSTWPAPWRPPARRSSAPASIRSTSPRTANASRR